VANNVSNTISGFSVSSSGTLTSVPGSPFTNSGAGPQAIAIDPRGKFVYVANSQSNSVSTYAIDAGTGVLQNVGSVGTAKLPVALAINPDGKYLYVLDQSSQNISAYGIDSVTGQPSELSGSPYAGAGSSSSMIVDPLGERIYLGNTSTIIAFRLFDNRGDIRLLRGSPFSGVSGAYGLGMDLSNSFLYAANNFANTISGFQVNKTSGVMSLLADSPYAAGTSPTSVIVINNFQ
jgi:YVTN family beta-propeller protein